MSLPLTPLNFVVDTLLSLWLSVMVAKGKPVWGMSVKQGTTLYLCLEDSTLRIQNRLFEITEDTPANVHFTTQSDILDKGLEEQLRIFLDEHPDTILVIIDASSRISYPSLCRWRQSLLIPLLLLFRPETAQSPDGFVRRGGAAE